MRIKHLVFIICALFAVQSALALEATGGTITTDGDYTIHTFTTDGTFNVTTGGTAEVLVVGGGGGGGDGGPQGGGGGAGGVLFGNYTWSTGEYSINIGIGGLGAPNNNAIGSTGENTTINTTPPILALGGGGGSGSNTGSCASACEGGSGGGKGSNPGTGGNTIQYNNGTLTGYGQTGGNTTGSQASGGGGATQAGQNSTNTKAGDGGDGLLLGISGTATWYGGGGGGAAWSQSLGAGGLGGGGNGTTTLNGAGQNALNETGGGGGGASDSYGGMGGSGIVIIRYLTDAGLDDYLTHEVFDQEFTSTVTIGTSFAEIGSVTYTVTAPSTDSYYNAEITTLGTQGTTTATCRLLDDNQEYARQSRTISNGKYGNFFISTPNINVSSGSHNLTIECLRTVGGKYDVVGVTLVGHLLYDANTNTNIGYQNNITNVTIPTTHGNFYNITYNTGTNYNTSTTNNLFLLLDWRASPTYTDAGNASIQWKIDDTWCTSRIRTGDAGTTGSVSGSCVVSDFLPSTTYTLELWGNASNTTLNDLKTHIIELVQHNDTVANTSLSQEPLNTTIPRAIVTTVVNSQNGGNFEIFTKASAHGNNLGTTEADVEYYLEHDGTQTRLTNRTKTSDGGIGNVAFEGAWEVSGIENKTVTLYGGATNNNSNILTGEVITYIVSAPTFSPNTFEVYAYNYYENTTIIQEFNVSIGGFTFQSQDGVATIVTGDQTPDINISAEGYFLNETLDHDRTTNFNASLIRHTHLRLFYEGSLVNNYSVNWTDTGTETTQQASTEDGSIFFGLQRSTEYNITVYNVNNNGQTYADKTFLHTVGVTPTEMINETVLLSNTFNLTFINEITEAFINESVTLELITSDSATNITINASDTDGYNISLLSPGEYTLRYRSSSFTERDYIITLNNNSFENLELYMIAISAASDISVNVENTAGEAVENATVVLTRYFASCNCYKTVEMDRTSPAGQGLFWVQAFEGHYKWSINYLGTNKFLSTSPENIITDARYFTIDTGLDFYKSYTATSNIGRAVTYNQSSGVLTFTWSDPSSIVTQGCLEASYVNGTSWDTIENCASGSTGSVVITLDNTTRYRYFARVDTNTDFSSHTLVSGWIDNFNNFLDAYGNLGAFLGASVMMGLSLLFSFSAIAVIVINIVGMLVLGLLGITKVTTAFILGFMTIGIGMAAFLMRR